MGIRLYPDDNYASLLKYEIKDPGQHAKDRFDSHMKKNVLVQPRSPLHFFFTCSKNYNFNISFQKNFRLFLRIGQNFKTFSFSNL